MEPSNSAIWSESEAAPQNEEQHHLLTLEALAEVNAGEGVEHIAVEAWAESLSELH